MKVSTRIIWMGVCVGMGATATATSTMAAIAVTDQVAYPAYATLSSERSTSLASRSTPTSSLVFDTKTTSTRTLSAASSTSKLTPTPTPTPTSTSTTTPILTFDANTRAADVGKRTTDDDGYASITNDDEHASPISDNVHVHVHSHGNDGGNALVLERSIDGVSDRSDLKDVNAITINDASDVLTANTNKVHDAPIPTMHTIDTIDTANDASDILGGERKYRAALIPTANYAVHNTNKYASRIATAHIALSVQNHPTTTTTSRIRNDSQRNGVKRQTPAPVPTPAPTTSTYDYWWPYPAETPAPTPTPTPTPTTDIPILFSVISGAPSSTNVVSTPPSSSISSTPSSSSPSSSTSVSTSATASSSASTNNSTSDSTKKLPFRLTDLLPAFGAVSVFVLGLLGWVVYGCCTRKAKTKTKTRGGMMGLSLRGKEDELVCGPPYGYGGEDAGGGGAFAGGGGMETGYGGYGGYGDHDEERANGLGLGHEMALLPKYPGIGHPQHQHGYEGSAGYRWPSYSERPAFDVDLARGRAHEDEHEDAFKTHGYDLEESAGLLSVALVAPGKSKTRRESKSSRTSRTSRTSRISKDGEAVKDGQDEEGKGLLSRHHSSATSAALRSLYQSERSSSSDEEHAVTEEYNSRDEGNPRPNAIADRRKEKARAKDREDEQPWESLRHKSIRRGIVEKVKWMDSVRSMAASAAAADGGGFVGGSPLKLSEDNEQEEGGRNERGGYDYGYGGDGGVGGTQIHDLDHDRGPSEQKAIGKRRGHVRADSDVYVDPYQTALQNAGTATSGPTATTPAGLSTTSPMIPPPAVPPKLVPKHKPLPKPLPTPTPLPRPISQSKSPPTRPRPSLARGRRSQAWLKDDSSDRNEDRYTRIPARRSESRGSDGGRRSESRSRYSPSPSPSRSRSRSRSRNGRPTKPLLFTRRRVVDGGDDDGRDDGGGGGWYHERSPHRRQRQMKRYEEDVSLREVLPQSPPQLMSPPLESQMFFTSLGEADNANANDHDDDNSNANIPSSSQPTSTSTPTPRTPTKIPTSKKRWKGKGKEKVKNSPPLPFPVSDDLSDSHRTPDIYRGRLLKKASSRPSPSKRSNALSPDAADRNRDRDQLSQGPPRSDTADTTTTTGMDNAVLKKLDEIMEVGWSERERDVGREGIRSLSPTGFGRRI